MISGWLHTDKGIQVFDTQLLYRKNYSYAASPGRSSISIGEPGNRVWSFFRRPGRPLFIGCQHAWLSIYDPSTESLSSAQPGPLAGIPSSTWFPTAHTMSGSPYTAASRNGTMETSRITITSLPITATPETQVFDLIVDKDQHLWVATQAARAPGIRSRLGSFHKSLRTRQERSEEHLRPIHSMHHENK